MSALGRRSALLTFALGAAIVAGTLPATADGPDGPTTASGTLLQLVVENPDEHGDDPLELHSAVQVADQVLAVPGDPVEAPSGTPVQVALDPAAPSTATVTSVEPRAGAQTGQPTAAAVVGGAHALTVVPVSWTSPDVTTGALSTAATAAAQYWQEQTDGRLSMSVSVRPWVSITAPTSCSGAEVTGIMNRALAASGVAAPTSTNHVLVYFPQYASCGWAGQASIGGGAVWVNGSTYVDVFAHELGHNLGLGHAKSATCTNGARVTLAPSLGQCSISEYGDYADVMGIGMALTTGNLNSAMADYLGLVTADRPSAGAYRTDTLAPLSSFSSLRAIAIPSSLGTVYVDYRPAAGRDQRVPSWAGVQVHLQVFNAVYGYPETYLLDLSPSTPTPFTSPQLGVGTSWNVPGSGLSIRTAGASGSSAQVTVYPTASGDPAVVSYITRVYLDLFGRGVDPTGLATWTNQLASGTPRGAVADAITGSREYRSGLIRRAYQDFLLRGPDAAGLESWLVQMDRGMTIQQMEGGFVGSPEYYGRAGGTDPGWVRAMYRDVLGREPSPGEVASWVATLASGGDRWSVAMGFLLSAERLGGRVDEQYVHVLGRPIDPQGLVTWVRALQGGARFESVIGGIVASEEYYHRG